MARTAQIDVSRLSLDLNNFRTVPQKTEFKAISAFFTINREAFFALIRSLMAYGYLVTENIIVQESTDSKLIVREGNRRIAALKILLGQVAIAKLPFPPDLASEIATVSTTWKKKNSKVPCAIYPQDDCETVDAIVSMTHGKGEPSGRDKWTSVARARHNRDVKGIPEPALDILEKYLKIGKNVTEHQKEKWAGDYPLTILAEAVSLSVSHFKVGIAKELAEKYPKKLSSSGRETIENVVQDIGLEILGFKEIRNGVLERKYSIAPAISDQAKSERTKEKNGRKEKPAKTDSAAKRTSTQAAANSKRSAHRTDSPDGTIRLLKEMPVNGRNRDKVATLQGEIIQLNIDRVPHAFCFLLRSMFEISAKAYCDDHAADPTAPRSTYTDRNGKVQDQSLAKILTAVKDHLISKSTVHDMNKRLHGACTELNKPEGILSCTSFNQLVHNPRFSASAADICTLFSNIFPLLEAMNS